MSDNADKLNPLFVQLVLSLQSAAMYQMGKTVSPVSGKLEKDLGQAKVSIDLMAMLQEKMAGNLHPEEKRFLDSTLYNLQMNYVEELENEKKKPDSGDKIQGSPDEPAQGSQDSSEDSHDK